VNRIDVHNHVLPGLDDGCLDMAESLVALRMMVDHGYDRIFCTPHTNTRDFTDVTTQQVAEAVAELQRAATDAGIPIALRPGGELRLTETTKEHMAEVGLPTYGHLGKYVVADTWSPEWHPWTTRAVEWLFGQGVQVIIAHPERMPPIKNNPAFIDELARMGVWFQGNLGPIAGVDAPVVVELGRRFLREGRYFMLGTDGHRPEALLQRLGGLAIAEELVGAAEVERLTVTNPGKLWE